MNGFLRVLGEKRDAVALGATAFVPSLPVFFDTVFFLLAPLARSMYARTHRNDLKYLLAMSARGVELTEWPVGILTRRLVALHPGLGPQTRADGGVSGLGKEGKLMGGEPNAQV